MHSPTHPLTRSLTHPLTHSLTHSLTHTDAVLAAPESDMWNACEIVGVDKIKGYHVLRGALAFFALFAHYVYLMRRIMFGFGL